MAGRCCGEVTGDVCRAQAKVAECRNGKESGGDVAEGGSKLNTGEIDCSDEAVEGAGDAVEGAYWSAGVPRG